MINSLYNQLFILSILLCVSLSVTAQETVEVAEKDIQYVPNEITVHLGQTLKIINKDPFFHKSRISMLSADGVEGKVVMKAEQENTKTKKDFIFEQTGKYKIRCMVHDGMTAIIDVIN